MVAFPAMNPPKLATLFSPVTHLEGRTWRAIGTCDMRESEFVDLVLHGDHQYPIDRVLLLPSIIMTKTVSMRLRTPSWGNGALVISRQKAIAPRNAKAANSGSNCRWQFQ
jgi:hypothetical protein